MLRQGSTLSGALLVVPLSISVLPALAGAFSIFRDRKALPSLADNYERMARIANVISRRLVRLEKQPNPQRGRKILEQFGREVIGEAVEWYSAHRKQRRIVVSG
jgi:hypothetical protein